MVYSLALILVGYNLMRKNSLIFKFICIFFCVFFSSYSIVYSADWQEPQATQEDVTYANPFSQSTPPKNIAVLLPLSGAFAGPGNAVKDGIKVAAEKSQAKPSIHYYDTATENITELYHHALKEGADCVVGPLLKSDATIVASLPHPVPTILLNDANVSNPDNLFLFSLSPSDEAKQVAEKAFEKNLHHALVLTPTGVWGEEVAKAFGNSFEKEGGQIVDVAHYAGQDDLNEIVQMALHIKQSEARVKKIRQTLGQKIESTPRRRQDLDMIFIIAYPSKARQILPLLKYYYAGDIPVYATSNIYEGSADARRDKDLDGVTFCDMPWIFSNTSKMIHNWPEQYNSYNRLYALGLDSYTLATQLHQFLSYPDTALTRKSGILSLVNQHIYRTLVWGVFKNGIARPTDPILQKS
jgi:outer membrane PBP1 activator LpoA protein